MWLHGLIDAEIWNFEVSLQGYLLLEIRIRSPSAKTGSLERPDDRISTLPNMGILIILSGFLRLLHMVACHLPRGSKLWWREDMWGGGLPNAREPRVG